MKIGVQFFIIVLCLFLSMVACDGMKSFSNKPEGAVEYIETSDGSVTLYEDQLEIEGKGIEGGLMTIDVDKIAIIKKYGHYMRISTSDGAELRLSMFSASQMTTLKEAIERLQQKGD